VAYAFRKSVAEVTDGAYGIFTRLATARFCALRVRSGMPLHMEDRPLRRAQAHYQRRRNRRKLSHRLNMA